MTLTKPLVAMRNERSWAWARWSSSFLFSAGIGGCDYCLNVSMVVRVLSGTLKVVHAVLVAYICMGLCSSGGVELQAVAAELGLTLVGICLSRQHRWDFLQVAFSLFLTYTFVPNHYSFLSGLFFLKIIYVFNSLGEAVEDLLAAPGNLLTRLAKILLSVFRFTLVEFLFLGLSLLGYKLFTAGDPEGTLPEDYIVLYQLVVTATTIGYGDITPKSRLQIAYFTYAIPFICASFVVYFNAVMPIIGELLDLLSGHNIPVPEGGCQTGEALSAKNWTQEERDNFVSFIEEVGRRQAEHDEHHKRVGHNWIALTANHYERQIPLLSAILKGDEKKEVRLKARDTSRDLMMLDEGELRNPAGQQAGFVFNWEGFRNGTPAEADVVTASFVAVWAISLTDLEELGQTSSRIRDILSEIKS